MNIIIRSLSLFSGLFFIPASIGAPSSDRSKCQDKYDWCKLFPNECDDPLRKATMEVKCPKTCGLCEQKMSPCALLSPCSNNGVCEDTASGWFKCTCPPGYTGERCERYECKNEEPYLCDFWAKNGQCCKNPEYMEQHCRKACGLCENPNKLQQECPCFDEDYRCTTMAEEGACCSNSSYMLRHCKRSCGQCGNRVNVPECQDTEPWCPSFPHFCGKTTHQEEMKKCSKTCFEYHKHTIKNTPPSTKMYESHTEVQMQLIGAEQIAPRFGSK